MANIIVAFPKPEEAKAIRNLLVKNGFRVTYCCTAGSQVIAHTDRTECGVIVCSYKLQDMVYTELRENISPYYEMILCASENRALSIHEKGITCLTMPLKVQSLLQCVAQIESMVEREKRRRRTQPRQRSEADRIKITQAKDLLMKKNGWTEDEAHKYVQKISMDSGTNMEETAEMILRMM